MSNAALLNIIFEDDTLLVLDKPADLVCHPTKDGPLSSLIGRVRLHLGGAAAFMINRLDRETSGLVLVAKERRVAAQLHRAFWRKEVLKEYLAIVHGRVCGAHGEINAPIALAPRREVAIRRAVVPDGQPARTTWWVEDRAPRFTLLRVRLHTGRAHQIRVHLAHIGHPIVGDKIYGSDERLYLQFIKTGNTPALLEQLLLPRHALHAERLVVSYGGGDPIEWRAPLPGDLAAFWREVASTSTS